MSDRIEGVPELTVCGACDNCGFKVSYSIANATNDDGLQTLMTKVEQAQEVDIHLGELKLPKQDDLFHWHSQLREDLSAIKTLDS